MRQAKMWGRGKGKDSSGKYVNNVAKQLKYTKKGVCVCVWGNAGNRMTFLTMTQYTLAKEDCLVGEQLNNE